MVFYLMFSFCYLVYHRVQFLVLWFSQCMPVLFFSCSLKHVKHCIADIRLLIIQNLLRLNDNKMSIIYLASTLCVKSLKAPALQMGASSITLNGSVTYIGIIFDKCFNMYGQVTSLC